MTHLVDTNVIGDALGPRPPRALLARLRLHDGRLAIASVTWNEMLYGMHRLPSGKKKNVLRDYLFDGLRRAMPILPYDEAAAAWHAEVRARLAVRGETAPFADGQIAAVAAVNELVLVTANTRDFAAFEGLVVEDWTRA